MKMNLASLTFLSIFSIRSDPNPTYLLVLPIIIHNVVSTTSFFCNDRTECFNKLIC